MARLPGWRQKKLHKHSAETEIRPTKQLRTQLRPTPPSTSESDSDRVMIKSGRNRRQRCAHLCGRRGSGCRPPQGRQLLNLLHLNRASSGSARAPLGRPHRMNLSDRASIQCARADRIDAAPRRLSGRAMGPLPARRQRTRSAPTNQPIKWILRTYSGRSQSSSPVSEIGPLGRPLINQAIGAAKLGFSSPASCFRRARWDIVRSRCA